MPWLMQPGMTSKPLCLDTSYLVGFFDETDRWHTAAGEIYRLLSQHQIEVSYLDCVLNELFTVLARRCRDRRSPEVFSSLLDRVAREVPESAINWLYPRVPRWYNRCLGLMRETHGELNFHDALIVVAIQELGFSALVSFDTGFDQVATVRRLGSTAGVAAWLREHQP